jgi:hypothetical protein
MIRSLSILIFFANVLSALAANYYVTQSGAGTHDGTSAANAWSVSDFNGTTKPTGGDTVSFTGNLSTGLNPSANGTFAARLLLDLKGATLNTQVTVSRKSYLTLSGGTTNMTSGTALRLDTANYLTIEGWTFNSSDINGWPTFAYSTYCTNLTFSDCTVKNCGYAFLGNGDDTVLISGCDVLSSQNGTNNIGNQTDLIHGGGWSNATIEKSKFVLRAPGSAKGGSDGSYRHNDVIQTFATGGSNGRSPSNWTIRYCWIQNDNVSPPSDGNSSWLMIESQGGFFKIYSNVFVCPDNAGGINNGVHMGSGKAGTEHVFYNNTVIKRNAPGAAISYNDANKPAGTGNGTLACVNNIAYCPLTGSQQGSTANNLGAAPISNNFWYNFGNHPGNVPAIPPGPGGSGTADPRFKDFNNDDFALAANSPCIGAGNNGLGSEYNKGIAPGSTWPNPTIVTRTGAWDVGAYVSNAGPAPSPTPTPIPTPTPTPTPIPSPTPGAKFSVGDYVTPSPSVNVRDVPAGTLLGTHAPPDIGTVKSGPTMADYNGAPVDWYEVIWATNPQDGWSGDDNLVLSDSPPPTPTPTPTPTPNPTATPTPTPTPTPGPTATPTPGTPTYEKWIQDQNNWIRVHPPYPDQKP